MKLPASKPPPSPAIIPASKKPLNVTKTFLLMAELLERTVMEMRRGTPSHTWDDMPKLLEDVRRVRAELEELAR